VLLLECAPDRPVGARRTRRGRTERRHV